MDGSRRELEGAAILADDLLALVFGYVDRPEDKQAVRLTCRSWLQIVNTHAVSSLKILRPGIIPSIVSRYSRISSLDLSCTRDTPVSSLNLIAATYHSNLTNLSVANNRRVADETLGVFGAACTNLVSLDLSNCHHDLSPITDSGIAAIGALSNLKSLKLTGCRLITDASLTCIAPRLSKLQELSLRWCTALTAKALSEVERHLRALHILDLSYCSFGDEALSHVCRLPLLNSLVLACCSNIEDSGLCRLGNGCVALTKLDLSGCKGITDRGISCIVAKCRKLKELAVAYDQQLSPHVLGTYHHLKDIQVLNLSGCSVDETGLLLLGAGCHDLTDLTLWRCEGVTDCGLAAIALGCRSLRQLDLTCCRGVTGVSLQALSDFCPRLELLRLEGFQGLTPADLLALSQRCRDLRELDLTDCGLDDTACAALAQFGRLEVLRLGFNPLTNAGLLTLGASYAPGGSLLRELDLYRCSLLEDTAVTAMLVQCPLLRKLNLSYCKKLTDTTLAAIARCSLLQNLDMRGVGATSAGFCAMARGCARLKDLDIKFCTALGDDALEHLVDHCPVLKQLHLSCCNFSDAGLAPLARCHTLQTMKMVQCKSLTGQCMKPFVSGCESLCKIKLDARLRAYIPPVDVAALEARLCYIKWMDKD